MCEQHKIISVCIVVTPKEITSRVPFNIFRCIDPAYRTLAICRGKVREGVFIVRTRYPLSTYYIDVLASEISIALVAFATKISVRKFTMLTMVSLG
jgi:hypothetical protein